MSETCQACGNDAAVHHLCTDCLAPSAEAIARGLAVWLGGAPADWTYLADGLAAYLA